MKYRQIAHKLRVQMGRGHPDWESERPRNKRTGKYLDLDEQGRSTTIVEPPGPHVANLLRSGAIQEYAEEVPASGKGCEPPDQNMA